MTRLLSVEAKRLGRDVRETLQDLLEAQVTGRCLPEGYVQPKSIRIQDMSMGKLQPNGSVVYDVNYVADVLFPREGQTFECVVNSINKMGIVGGLADSQAVKIIVPRDLYVDDPYYQAIRTGDTIDVKTVAQDFHYGSTSIIVVAELVKPAPAAPEAPALDDAQDAAAAAGPGTRTLSFGDGDGGMINITKA